jgi:hypothetical protein
MKPGKSAGPTVLSSGQSRKMRRSIALLSIALLASGCAFQRQTTGMAVDYNEFVAQTTNRQTLLNILRAREREPMHFTSFSRVLGTMKAGGTLGLGAALNGDAGSLAMTDTSVTTSGGTGVVTSVADTASSVDTATFGATNFTPSFGISVNTGTDFDIAVNATDEFYRGILGPLKDSVVVHFLRQGFPADLLSHLVIGELRFYAVFKKGGKDIDNKGQEWSPGEDKYGHVLISAVRNAPDDEQEIEKFENAMNCRNLTYSIVRRDKRSIGLASVSDLSSVSPELIGKITSEGAAGHAYKYNIGESSDFGLALSERKECTATIEMLLKDAGPRIDDFIEDIELPPRRPERAGCEDRSAPRRSTPRTVLRSKTLAEQSTDLETSSRDELSGAVHQFEAEDFLEPLLCSNRIPAAYTGDLVIEITLRSVEGILYYLGEYIRNPELSPKLYGAPCPAENGVACIPVLVVARKGEVPGETFADVLYRGTRYVVPLSGASINPVAGRSSQTISLVQQLLNLHRSSKDLPVTPLVRVAN